MNQFWILDTSLRTRVRVADRGYANDLRAGAEGYAQYKFWILLYERECVSQTEATPTT
ncbi:MAG: hypothetical protein HEQ35_15735 [Gloeotrichia echinulata IR180]